MMLKKKPKRVEFSLLLLFCFEGTVVSGRVRVRRYGNQTQTNMAEETRAGLLATVLPQKDPWKLTEEENSEIKVRRNKHPNNDLGRGE